MYVWIPAKSIATDGLQSKRHLFLGCKWMRRTWNYIECVSAAAPWTNCVLSKDGGGDAYTKIDRGINIVGFKEGCSTTTTATATATTTTTKKKTGLKSGVQRLFGSKKMEKQHRISKKTHQKNNRNQQKEKTKKTHIKNIYRLLKNWKTHAQQKVQKKK
jgi:hypothetical protein